MNAAELKELIDTAKDKIDDYHQHSLGKINFWATIPGYDNHYVICVENARNDSSCILQVKSAEKCNDFLHSLAAHFLFYLVI